MNPAAVDDVHELVVVMSRSPMVRRRSEHKRRKNGRRYFDQPSTSDEPITTAVAGSIRYPLAR